MKVKHVNQILNVMLCRLFQLFDSSEFILIKTENNSFSDTDLVDDEQKSGDVFLELAAGVVLLRPQPFVVAVSPRFLLLTRAARVRSGARRQSVAGQVRSDPRQSARPPAGSRTKTCSINLYMKRPYVLLTLCNKINRIMFSLWLKPEVMSMLYHKGAPQSYLKKLYCIFTSLDCIFILDELTNTHWRLRVKSNIFLIADALIWDFKRRTFSKHTQKHCVTFFERKL